MQTAVVFLWIGCLWSIARSVLHLICWASPWRRLLVLAVLVLTASCAHRPREREQQMDKSYK